MTRRILLPAVSCLILCAATWADALDDDLNAAKALLASDNVDQASARLDALEASARLAVAANPGDAHAQYILGMAAMYAGRDKVAKPALDMAVRLEPKNLKYVMGRAQFAQYTDAPKDAVKYLQGVLPDNGGHLELLEMLGHAQQAAGQFADAQATFEKAAAASPKEPRYRAEMAECLVSLHQEDKALAMYQQALDLNPKYALALANIGQIYQNRKTWDKAIESYAKVVAINPEDYRTVAKLVQLNEAAGNIKERDAAREKVFALQKAGKIDTASYCREQFADGTTSVMVFESFELKGPMAVRYAFNVINADGKTVEKRISLGSYLETTAIARELGQIKDGERMFHLDVYTPAGHETLGMFTKEPTYEETRDRVKQYLAGKLQPLSATVAGSRPGAASRAVMPTTTQGGR
jgi:tetratricopeptide (TPR) repeat protein